MSLTHIEELNKTLDKARSGQLSDREFQIVVLQGLISLKESHVSLRSRLFNLEEDLSTQNQPQSMTTTDLTPAAQSDNHNNPAAVVVTDETTGLQLIEEDLPEDQVEMKLHETETISSQTIGEDFNITSSMLKHAKKHFDYTSVRVFEKLFNDQLPENEAGLPFNRAVALLNRLGFKHYGEGKYPLPHYLREIVGDNKIVTFPNFIQAISFSMNNAIPLGLKNGFEKMDVDLDGELDLEEVYNMLQMVSKSNYSREDCMSFLLAADRDSSGALSYVETLRLFYFS